MKSLVEITQFRKTLDDFQLGPINLMIEPGTITALVGNNGSGKSTLIKSMMGLVKSNQGTIKMFDQFVHQQDEDWKKEVAYQPQTTIGSDAFTGKALKDLVRSEEHTSELLSRGHLVCRLLLEKKKQTKRTSK